MSVCVCVRARYTLLVVVVVVVVFFIFKSIFLPFLSKFLFKVVTCSHELVLTFSKLIKYYDNVADV